MCKIFSKLKMKIPERLQGLFAETVNGCGSVGSTVTVFKVNKNN